MIIDLNADFYAKPDTHLLGYVGETQAREIAFNGLSVDGADFYKMRLTYSDGVTYDVDITSGKYIIDGSLLRIIGNVKVQILAYAVSGEQYSLVKKSNIFLLYVKPSLGGEPAPIPTYEEALEALDKLNNKIIIDDFGNFPEVGNKETIYIAQDKSLIYMWDGERYYAISGSGGGVSSYEDLLNLPKLNGVEIIGEKTDEEYGIDEISNIELEKILR